MVKLVLAHPFNYACYREAKLENPLVLEMLPAQALRPVQPHRTAVAPNLIPPAPCTCSAEFSATGGSKRLQEIALGLLCLPCCPALTKCWLWAMPVHTPSLV